MKFRSSFLKEAMTRLLRWVSISYKVNVLGKVYITFTVDSVEKWKSLLDTVGENLDNLPASEKCMIADGIKYIIIVNASNCTSYVSFKYRSIFLCERDVCFNEPLLLTDKIRAAAHKIVAVRSERRT